LASLFAADMPQRQRDDIVAGNGVADEAAHLLQSPP
jgi:hypothetical protein